MRTHLRLPDGSVDLLGAVVERTDGTHALSPLEVAALSVLAEAAPETVTEQELLQKAWGYRTTNTRTVSMGISRLRKKLEPNPRAPTVLLTVRGLGYRLVVEEEARSASADRGLFGRDEDRRTAEEHLNGRGRVELVGPGGIGKTRLARALAPDGVWVDLHGIEDEVGLWRRLAGAFGAEGEDTRAAVRRLWRAHRGRAVLDNAEALDASARRVLVDLVGDAGGQVLVTTRVPLGTGPVVLLEPLRTDEALRMVQHLRRDAGLPPVEPSLLDPVLQQFGGHPLALGLAAPMLELHPSRELLLDLPEPSREDTLRSVFSQTLEALDSAQRMLLASLACFAVPPDLATLCQVLDQPAASTLRDLHAVRARGLLSIDGDRIMVHPFLRTLAVTDTARDRHRRWAAALPFRVPVLSRHRAEIEAAFPGAEGETLLDLLLRHVFLLDQIGPKDHLLEEVEQALPRVLDDPRSQVVHGLTLASVLAWERAIAVLLDALDRLDDTHITWRAWALIALGLVAGGKRPDLVDPVGLELAAIRDAIPDGNIWATATLRAAWSAEPEQARRLRAEVLARHEELPEAALVARVHLAHEGHASLPEVDAIERALNELGPSHFSSAGWGLLWGFLIRLRCEGGDHQGALERLEALPERFWLLDPDYAERATLEIAVHLWPRPALSHRAAARLTRPDRQAIAAYGLVTDPDPIEGPTGEMLLAYRSGLPIPGNPRSGLRRALLAAREQGARVPGS